MRILTARPFPPINRVIEAQGLRVVTLQPVFERASTRSSLSMRKSAIPRWVEPVGVWVGSFATLSVLLWLWFGPVLPLAFLWVFGRMLFMIVYAALALAPFWALPLLAFVGFRILKSTRKAKPEEKRTPPAN